MKKLFAKIFRKLFVSMEQIAAIVRNVEATSEVVLSNEAKLAAAEYLFIHYVYPRIPAVAKIISPQTYWEVIKDVIAAICEKSHFAKVEEIK